MGNPWLRLDAHYFSDSALLMAGPNAALVWPHVLAALKRAQGVASDVDLDPRVLARLVGGTEAMWATGIESLKVGGLLVKGERSIKVGRAPAATKAGWVTPGWDIYQPDARKGGWSRKKKNGPGPNRTEPDRTERSGSSPDSRVPSRPVSSVEVQEPDARVGLGGPVLTPDDREAAVGEWLAKLYDSPWRVSPLQQERVLDIVRGSTPEERSRAWSTVKAASMGPRAWLQCFDESGAFQERLLPQRRKAASGAGPSPGMKAAGERLRRLEATRDELF